MEEALPLPLPPLLQAQALQVQVALAAPALQVLAPVPEVIQVLPQAALVVEADSDEED